MKIIDQINWIIPSHYASAIINNDYSGLTDEEEIEINNFLSNKIKGQLTIENMEDDHYFSWINDVNNLGSDVLNFVELIYK